jgi:tetraacyldisaccharide 4'-kinase
MLSWLYGAGVTLRARLYGSGALKRARLPHPVVSIGNLTTGGTGKTPVVLYLAGVLRRAGLHPAVLSRGYRGHAENKRLLVSDGVNTLCGPGDAGDEPFLIAGSLPGVPVAVGKDRSASARLIPGFGTDSKLVFLLDDGYQRLQLERDIDILLLDASDPFGGGRLLPFGRLREPLSAMARADRILITRAHLPFDQEGLETQVRLRNRRAQISYFYHDALGLLDPATGQTLALRGWENKRVVALCAIGAPDVFLRDLAHYQMSVVESFVFRDHHPFTQDDLTRVAGAADRLEAEAVVTTEKDAVRLGGLDVGARLLALRIAAKPEESAEFERGFLQEVRESVDNRQRSFSQAEPGPR